MNLRTPDNGDLIGKNITLDIVITNNLYLSLSDSNPTIIYAIRLIITKYKLMSPLMHVRVMHLGRM